MNLRCYFLFSLSLFVILLSTFCFLFSNIALASTSNGTIDSFYKYSWAERLGWLNFGTTGGNVHVTDTSLTGYIWSQNYGWINLSPNYGGGVNNNNEGTLSGYAWGQNIGWINFSGVTISSNGEFSGTASGTISGAVSFNCLNCKIKTDWRPLSVRQPAAPPPTPPVAPPASRGSPMPVLTQVAFTGKAYPLSKVTILKDGQAAVTTIAGLDANFNVVLGNLSSGNFLFSVFSEDSAGRRSPSFSFPITAVQGSVVTVSGIFLSPTIDTDKTEVKRGDNIAILGQSVPNGTITISINSEEEFSVKTTADKNGAYLYWFDTTPLEIGSHLAKSKAATEGLLSSFGSAVGFTVGTKSLLKGPVQCPSKGDINGDCRVNLVDFSIAAYWYKRPLNDAFKQIEKDKLNGDGKVDLIDFSIMAYYWTG